MTKIAVISAYPNKLNPGMIASDIGVIKYCKENISQDVVIDRFCVEKEINLEAKNKDNSIKYDYLYNPEVQLKDYKYIFFWGDFLHTIDYIHAVKRRMLRNGLYKNSEEALSHVFKRLLFENVSQTMKEKSLVIGGSLIINQGKGIEDVRYRSAISDLYSNCKFVSLRDPISSNISKKYSNIDNCRLGIDCAFYYHPIFKKNDSLNDNEKNLKVGYYFGKRTKSKYKRYILNKFIRYLSRDTRVSKIIDIDWFDIDEKFPINDLENKLKKIQSCDFIITDTYHCAVNSFSLGTPAFCIGKASSKSLKTVDDKKKEVLYLMFGAHSMYIYQEHLLNLFMWRKVKNKILNSLLNDKEYVNEVLRSISSVREKTYLQNFIES